MKKSVFTLVIAGAVFIGYFSGCKRNEMPVIESLVPENSEDTLVVAGDTVKVICTATDADENELFYTWDASGGGFTESEDGTEITWIAPNQSGVYNIVCKVTDLEEDTVNLVADTLTIDVQNYFPVDMGYWWHYEGFMWVIDNYEQTLTRTIYSREDQTGGEIIWHIESKDSCATWGEPGGVIDSTDFYSIKDNEIFESIHVYFWRWRHLEGTICDMPLWKGKTWTYSDSGTATVLDIRDRGTEAFSFENCAQIEITITGDTVNVRTIWLAPDVGIIEDQLESDGSKRYELELIDYEFKE